MRKKAGCQVQKKCECRIKFEINWFLIIPFIKWHACIPVFQVMSLFENSLNDFFFLEHWNKTEWIFFLQTLIHSTCSHPDPSPQNMERVYLVSSSGSWLSEQVLTRTQLYIHCKCERPWYLESDKLGCDGYSLVMRSWARCSLLCVSFFTHGKLDS